MKHFISKNCCFILLLILISCDGWYSYEYKINNQTDYTVKLIVNDLPGYNYNFGNPFQDSKTDSVFTILPNSSITIDVDGSLSGYNYKPDDLRDYSKSERTNSTIPFLADYITEILINDISVSSEHWEEEKWSFKSKKLLGIYSINITTAWK